MSEDCPRIDPLVTPYVDGELPSADRVFVDRHIRACSPCGARVAAERAVRALMGGRRATLGTERAPDSLRARCAALRSRTTSDAAPAFPGAAQTFRPSSWRARLAPLALA